MEYKSQKVYGNVIVAQREDYQWGVLDLKGNTIVPFGKYGWIDGFEQGLARVRTHGDSGRVPKNVSILDFDSEEKPRLIEGKENIEVYIKSDRVKHPEQYAKWGIINEEGKEVLPVENDDVWNFLGKNRFSTKVVINGKAHNVFFHDLNPDLPRRGQRAFQCDDEDYDYYDYNDNRDDNSGIDYEEETWYALTDGMYGDYPGSGFDYDCLGF